MLHQGPTEAVRRAAVPVVRGCILLAALTAAGRGLHLTPATTGFLYLIAVVLNGMNGGPLASTIVSFVAVGCLDYFFISPLLTLTVDHPEDVAGLAAFLTSSLVVGRLSAKARMEARTAGRKRRQVERLYELAQRLLYLDPLRLASEPLLEAIRSAFQLKAVAFFDASTAELHTVGDPAADLADATRQAYIAGLDSDDAERHTTFRCLGPAQKRLGAIGAQGLDDGRFVGGAIAALAATGLERSHAVREASRIAAEAQSETLRAAILDALAHEFKTPLATILTAAGGLREAGPLGLEQSELAEMVETESMRLSNLSTHLLRVARLDREDVKTRLEPANMGEVVTAVVERFARQSPGRPITFHAEEAPGRCAIDVELYQLALSQLLDNACRYSPADSAIDVSLEARGGFLSLIVWNAGRTIPADERKLVFERFYRGREARRETSGTGLGLYVARKIAVAHGGGLEFDQTRSQNGTAFRLSVAALKHGSEDYAETAQNSDRRR